MDRKETVLCAASAYERKYYFNDAFSRIPDEIKDELQIMCVTFTEDVGGVILLAFNEQGNLTISTQCAEEDLLYDDIGSELKIREIQNEKKDLLMSLETYYKVFNKS